MPAIVYITREEYNRNPKKWKERKSKKINDRVEVRIVEEEEEKQVAATQSISQAVTAQAATIEQVVEDVSHESTKDILVFAGRGLNHSTQVNTPLLDSDNIEVFTGIGGIYVIKLRDGVPNYDVAVHVNYSSTPIIRSNPYDPSSTIVVNKRVEVLYPSQVSRLFGVSDTNEVNNSYYGALLQLLGQRFSNIIPDRTFVIFVLEELVDINTGVNYGTYLSANAISDAYIQAIKHPQTREIVNSISATTITITAKRYNIPKPVKAVASSAYYGYYNTESAIGLENL